MLISSIIKKILKRTGLKKTPPFTIDESNNVEVGKMTYHNGNLEIKGDQNVRIGSYCAFGKNVSIITSNHDYNYTSIQGSFYKHYFSSDHPGVTQTPPNKERTKGNVSIGNDVWIADNVSILSGIKIGNGACIANNSVITKDVLPYTIVAGIPAKEIKKRYSIEKIDFLESLNWWNWDEDKIKRNKTFFTTDINKTSLDQLKKIIKQ